jgi:hypothetical protein
MATAAAPKPGGSRKKTALRVAMELHQTLQKAGAFQFRDDYEKKLAVELKPFKKDAYAGFVSHLARAAERSLNALDKFERPDQPRLPGIDWGVELEGYYKLPHGWRIAKRLATKDHMQAVLQQDQANLEKVEAAHDRKRKVFELLKPYWEGDTTKEQAVQAFLKAHPKGK